MTEDYYSILGLSRNAILQDIEKAYKKMVLKWHPDICKDKEMGNKQMKKINAAYEVLASEEKKSAYDQFLNRGGNTNEFDNYQNTSTTGDGFHFDESFSDVFRSFFSSSDSSNFHFSYRNSGQSSSTGSDFFDNAAYKQNNANKNIRITMTLEEWFCGTKQQIEYKRKIECKNCKAVKKICEYCKGAGATKSFFVTSMCSRCGGHGFHIHHTNCTKCKGRCIDSTTKFTLNIPRFPQQNMYVKGYGNFNGIEYGSLEIMINVLEHKVYKINGSNIYRNIKIGVDDFLKGTKITFKYLDEQNISLEIPKLKTKPITIYGKGILTREQKGNLIINIQVVNNVDNSKNINDILSFLNCSKIDDNTYLRN